MLCNHQNINDFCCKKYSYSYINTTSNNGVVVVDNSATAPVLRTDNTTGITKIITQNSTDPISTCDINDDNEEINEYECYLIYRYQCEGYISDPPLETFKNSQIDIVNNAYETSLADGVVVTINNKDVILGASIIDQISYKSILSYAQALYDDDTDAVMPSFSDKNGNIYTLSYTDLVSIFKTYFVKVVYYKNLKDSLVSQILLCSSVDDLQQINWCNNKILVGNIKSTSISPLIVKKSIQDCEDIQQISSDCDPICDPDSCEFCNNGICESFCDENQYCCDGVCENSPCCTINTDCDTLCCLNGECIDTISADTFPLTGGLVECPSGWTYGGDVAGTNGTMYYCCPPNSSPVGVSSGQCCYIS
jgi:hypothetical protein